MKKLILAFSLALLIVGNHTLASEISQEQALKKVVQIFVVENKTEKVFSSGSGIIIDANKRHIATALHVIDQVANNNSKFDLYVCINEDVSERPSCYFLAKVYSYDTKYDIAIIEIDRAFDKRGRAESISLFEKTQVNELLSSDVRLSGEKESGFSLGKKVWIAGFPASGGDTVTIGTGELSGVESGEISYGKTTVQLKTSAPANRGNSGGPAFSEENTILGIVTSVQTDISPITFLTAWPVVDDLIKNGVVARPGVLCPDYQNMKRKSGQCICNDDLLWNEEQYRCEAKESEDNLDEESPPTEESSDILQKQTFTKQEQDKSEETKEDSEEQSSDIDSEEEQTREEKNGLTEEEKTLGSMKTRAGIISVIVNCKDIKRYGKEAYRTCFKEEFLSFIRNRQKAIRKANALCRKELGKETVTRSLRLCRQEKFSE